VVQLKRVLVIHKKSLFELYTKDFDEQAIKHAIAIGDPVARRMVQSHGRQRAALDSVVQTLTGLGLEHVVRWRGQARSTSGFDLVLALGGDGTILDASHRILDQTPLLGINSDPTTSVGVLAAGTARHLGSLLSCIADGSLRPISLTRLRLRVEQQTLLKPALNELLFAHGCPAEMSRFQIGVFRKDLIEERGAAIAQSKALQSIKSSGIWIASAAGSTAAIRSAGGRRMSLQSKRLQFRVREPYDPPARGSSHTRGWIGADEVLLLISRVRRGVFWADGSHCKIAVAYGQPVLVDTHPCPLRLFKS
jgi:NAD+ kinase